MESKNPLQNLDALERDIKHLQVEFARFFAGDREKPPLELREQLGLRLRGFQAAPHPSTVDAFRLSSLTARLGSLSQLVDRRMLRHQARSATRARPTDAVIAGSERGSRAVRRLFLELYKQENTPASIATFQQFLERKVSEIRTRTGCSSVQFKVIENEGRRSLKAKPLGRTPAKR